MLIAGDRHRGRIGRPEVVAAILEQARALIAKRQATSGDSGDGTPWLRATVQFRTGPVLGESTGGRIEVLIEAFGSAELDVLSRLAEMTAIVGRPLVSGAAPSPGADPLAGPQPLALLANGTMLVERLADPHPEFHVYGTGALAHALVGVLAPLPFRTIWHDSAPDHFPAMLPDGVEMAHGYDPVAAAASAPAGAFHAVMTSDHQLDLAIVSTLSKRGGFAYLGVIGSRLKAERLRARLREDGLEDTALARISCPIGLRDLQSKNPAVIAVSIAAEALLVLRA